MSVSNQNELNIEAGKIKKEEFAYTKNSYDSIVSGLVDKYNDARKRHDKALAVNELAKARHNLKVINGSANEASIKICNTANAKYEVAKAEFNLLAIECTEIEAMECKAHNKMMRESIEKCRKVNPKIKANKYDYVSCHFAFSGIIEKSNDDWG